MQRLFFLLALFLIPSVALPQYYTLTGDFQDPDKQFTIPAVFSGNTPFLRYEQFERNDPWSFENTTNGGPWTMYFRYSYGQYDTNGMVTLNGTISSNVVTFGGTNVLFQTYDYYFSIFGINLLGQQKTFARGIMHEKYDPASGTNITAMIGQMNLSWWSNNIGLQIVALQTGKLDRTEFASYATTNEPLWVAASNSVEQRIASNEAAIFSQIQSNAYLSTNINTKLDSNTWATAQAAEIATNNQLAAWALANSNAIAAETTARIGADTALSNQLVNTSNSLAAAIAAIPGAVAVDTNALIAGIAANSNAVVAEAAARAAADTNYVAKTGDQMLGNLDVGIYTGYFRTAVIGVGGMVMKPNGASSSTGIVFQTGNPARTRSLWNYAGNLYKDTYRIFDESNLSTGDLWGAISTNIALDAATSNALYTAITNNAAVQASTNAGFQAALDRKQDSAALITQLTVGDLASVGTNLCTGFVTQTGTLGGVKVTNIYCNITGGKVYAWGLGLQSTYLGTSWLSCAGFTLTNGTPGSRASNYFSLATSTDRVVLTISSVAGMAQIVTNVYVCEVRTGTVWVAGDILAANYGHDIPLMTNTLKVLVGISAMGDHLSVAVGGGVNASNRGTAVGNYANAKDLGVAVGYYANGHSTGAAVGNTAIGSENGAAFGYSANGNIAGAAVGYGANGQSYGAAIGKSANGQSYGAAVGYGAIGSKTNVAIGAAANSLGGSERISIGHGVTNSIDNSAALRGTLYLDGGTGIYYRSTFGTGAWLPYGSGGGDMTQAAHDVSAHATNYVPRTGGNIVGNIVHTGDYTQVGNFLTGDAGMTTVSIGASDPVTNISSAATASGSGELMFASAIQTALSGVSSPNLVALSNGVNSWLSSSGQLAVVTNDYPAGTLGIVASSDGGTTLYLKAEATAGAELDPIAGALGTNNALSIQTVGVVATNAQTWAVAASNLAAGAQTKTNRWTPATAVCSTGTVQFAPGADTLYTYLPTNPFTVQMAYGVTDVGTVRFEVQASTCTITWGASIKNSGRDSSTNLTMSTTTNMSFILDKRYGESKASIYQIGL